MARLSLDGRLRDVPVARLSAGQRRRTAFAVLLARRAELWLLDEPHAGLDQAGRDLLDELVHSATAQGATVVIASHEHERSGALADRVVNVVGGMIDHTVDPVDPQPVDPQPVDPPAAPPEPGARGTVEAHVP
jgi:energy-coupling factor transporter ATP-binding protein EcfA2